MSERTEKVITCDHCGNERRTTLESYGGSCVHTIRNSVRMLYDGRGLDFCDFACAEAWIDDRMRKAKEVKP